MCSSATPFDKNILIYREDEDRGTCEASCVALYEETSIFPHKSIEYVDSHYLVHNFWEHRTLMLVLPGGVCSVWERKLGLAGMKKIQNFVHTGGRVLGICAGGYFMSTRSLFSTPSVVIEKERPYPLLPVNASGPIRRSSSSREIAEAVLLTSPVGHSGEVYYQQGCSFSPNPETSTLASYEDGSSAIVSAQFGDGLVAASGPHIEFKAPRTRSPFEDGFAKNLLDRLSTGDSFRMSLWEAVYSAFFPDSPRESASPDPDDPY